MKIAVNLLPFHEQIAGAGKYAKNIIYSLSLIDQNNDYYLFVTKHGVKNFENLPNNFHLNIQNFNNKFILFRIFWEQFVFPIKLFILKPDVLFTPSVAVPIFFRGNFHTTIHDIAYRTVRNKYPLVRRLYIRIITYFAIHKSNRIFTVSDFSKNEIIKFFGINNSKISITYNGIDNLFLKKYSDDILVSFKEKYHLPNRYFLYVGAIEPGKNIDKLLNAYAEFNDSNLSDDYSLVLTSGVGWMTDFFEKELSKLALHNKVHLLPYLEDEEMPLLYKSASVVIYLSGYEGFGIPVLESMISKIPVITSKSEAILEFANDSVFSVDPDNIKAIVETLKLIIREPKIVEQHVAKGYELATEYTWQKSAEKILKEFNSI